MNDISISNNAELDDDGFSLLLRFMSTFHPPLQDTLKSLSMSFPDDPTRSGFDAQISSLKITTRMLSDYRELLQKESACLEELFNSYVIPHEKRVELLQYLTLPSMVVLEKFKRNAYGEDANNIILASRSRIFECVD